MTATAPSPPPLAALAWGVAVLVAQRLWELRLSAHHARRLKARGAVEHGRRHFPLLVTLHVLFLLSLVGEVWIIGARPGPLWPLWISCWAAAQILRYGSIRALGVRWTVRIWVIPGAPPVRHGPYRFLRHPNYLAVGIELFSAPLVFGAWRTAILFAILHLAAMAIRIPVEERALSAASASPADSDRHDPDARVPPNRSA